jgi:hypothetical protein
VLLWVWHGERYASRRALIVLVIALAVVAAAGLVASIGWSAPWVIPATTWPLVAYSALIAWCTDTHARYASAGRCPYDAAVTSGAAR